MLGILEVWDPLPSFPNMTYRIDRIFRALCHGEFNKIACLRDISVCQPRPKSHTKTTLQKRSNQKNRIQMERKIDKTQKPHQDKIVNIHIPSSTEGAPSLRPVSFGLRWNAAAGRAQSLTSYRRFLWMAPLRSTWFWLKPCQMWPRYGLDVLLFVFLKDIYKDPEKGFEFFFAETLQQIPGQVQPAPPPRLSVDGPIWWRAGIVLGMWLVCCSGPRV